MGGGFLLKRPYKRYRSVRSARYGYKDKDWQGARVYSAERDTERGKRLARHFQSLDQVVSWMNRSVLRSDWWQQLRPLWVQDTVEVAGTTAPYWKKRGKNYGTVTWDRHGTCTLWLPRWAWTDMTVFHELAHVTTLSALSCHGPEFAASRLAAQYECGLRGSGEALDREYGEYGVEVKW
jgi:hypothetical protein